MSPTRTFSGERPAPRTARFLHSHLVVLAAALACLRRAVHAHPQPLLLGLGPARHNAFLLLAVVLVVFFLALLLVRVVAVAAVATVATVAAVAATAHAALKSTFSGQSRGLGTCTTKSDRPVI